MKRRRHAVRWTFRLAGCAALAVLASCEGTQNSVADPGQGTPTAALTDCGEECVLFRDVRPFKRSHFLPDSSNATLELARYTLEGSPGDRVVLVLNDVDPELNAAVGHVPVTVNIDRVKTQFSLFDLLEGRVVYTFREAEQIVVRYSIPRALPELSAQQWTLSQRLGGARIMNSQNPWSHQVSPLPVASVQPFGTVATCTTNDASFAVCGVSGTIVPYATAVSPVGCIWSSAATTAPSTTITITLAQPVNQVAVTICDADFSGNAMTAFDVNDTQLGTYAFTGDGQPGTDSQQRGTIAKTGIRKVTLTVAPNDYVTYQNFQITVPAADSLIVTPGAATRISGQTVTFTVKSVSKKGVVTVQKWDWQPSVPPFPSEITTIPPTCTGTSCTIPVYESGKVFVYGSVNEIVASSGSAAVTVTPCPPLNDPDNRMNDPGFIKSLVELVNVKGNERGGQVYSNLQGEFRVMEMRNTAPIPCRQMDFALNADPLSPPPDGWVRDNADGHTHPWPATQHFTFACDPSGTLTAGIGPSGSIDPVSKLATGDYPFESLRNHVGYLADADGIIWRWGSPLEFDFVHPTPYLRTSDSNGYSVCLTKLAYPN
jgi:hypothetical protein